ncbi:MULTISPECIES: AMP-binding protein [Burkholderia]|uniref:AMP-binding protein n=1 Tax=Burkholderia TaxID=32008 RepID=UPI000398A9EA|nr:MULTISPECIES: AMP-binding protein [Burkholderia]ERJ37731.1 Long-chain-fatty-acid--CoA ligase [Burkholderia sp. AU4i]MBA9948842.1 long-chain fatty acid--CoA ligase [Burkholderia cepacia]MBA9979128.1 long-chain fatty acid--CoA ligase [Burkholderia cepacia]MBA9997812.1 long-chain fatty acid--CoA ligase [Burkholderia cepacia]MBB0005857.1 long-chain fatty acid--CoA ligase [Burkholderia cepacia]
MKLKPESHEDFPIMEMCVGDALDRAAGLWSDSIGWVFEDQSISYRQMKEQVDRVARALLASGVRQRDVVAVWMPNLAHFAYLELACAKIGAIIGAINTRSKVFEVKHFLEHSEATVLVMVDHFLKHDFVATLDAVCPTDARQPGGDVEPGRFGHLRKVVSLSDTPDSRALPWDDFLALAESVPPEQLEAVQKLQKIDDPILIQYTSGTTSLPKGALCNHRYVLNFGGVLMRRLGMEAGDAFLNTQPFYHVGGSCGAVPAPLTIGCKVVSAEYYEVERILALIERERCVARSGYGAMYIMEMNHPRFREFDISSLQAGWCVGTAELMKRVRDEMHIPGLLQIYGATEVGGTSAWVDDDWDARSKSCGTPIHGTELKIVDPLTGDELPAGEIGEICMRGWWQMNGYLKQPEETEKAIDAQGWMHTGDLGRVDAHGYLYFSSRLKDMLKIGGENVSAQEVEAVLLSHPRIAQAAVIGAPDERLSEVVMAIVEPRHNEQVTEKEVIAWCAQHMANFRVPRHVRITTTWPLTDSGKIQKHKLREQYLAP